MPIPTNPGTSTVKHPEYTDENGVTWIITPKGKHIKGANEPIDGFYIGYSSTGGVQGYITPNSGYTPYSTRNTAGKGYSRNTAATAKDIAQGGMTKDEIQQFNIAHPNETAWRNE